MTLLDKAIFRDDLRQGVDWNVNNETKVGPYDAISAKSSDGQSIRRREMTTLRFLWEIAVFDSTPTSELYKSHLSKPVKNHMHLQGRCKGIGKMPR